MKPLLRSALVGAATGGRTFTGLAALTLASPSRASAQPDKTLGIGLVKGVVAAAALQEWVMDKLPQTPSRLEPAGLVARLVTAAGAGVIVARRHEPRALVAPALDASEAGRHAAVVGPGGLEPVPEDLSRVRVALHSAVAVAVAAATSWLGPQWRTWAAAQFGRDYVGAGVEDAASLALAVTGAKR